MDNIEISYHACETLEFDTFTGSSDGCVFVLSACIEKGFSVMQLVRHSYSFLF